MRDKPPFRRLLLALLLSLLAHLLLVRGLPSWFADKGDAAGIPIKVALIQPPAKVKPPPPLHPAKKKAKHKLMPGPESRKPEPPPPVREELAPLEPSTQPVVEAPEPLPPALPKDAAPMPVVPPASEGPADEAYQMPADEPEPAPPTHVEAEYKLLRNGGVVGTERHSFYQRPDGSYVLISIAAPKGLLALALGELHQTSEGHVTEEGLRPDTFLYQYGKEESRARKATFDWQSSTLTMESGSRRQSVPLAPGTQDLMSFMYQFMYVPPLQNMQLEVTNGKRLRTYAYMFEGEELLETEVGRVQCIKISKTSGDNDEKTELWLANELHYLPVKIRMTDEDGTTTERVISRLLLE